MTYAGPPPEGISYPPPPSFQPAGARLGPGQIVVIFIGVLLALTLIGAVFILVTQPPPPIPQCQPGQPCAPPAPSLPPVSNTSPLPTLAPASGAPATSAPPQPTPSQPAPSATPLSDSPPVITGQQWRDDSLGYAFEYDPEVFTVSESADGLVVLNGNFFDAQIVVRAAPAASSPAEMIARQLNTVDRFLVGRVADTDEYDALLGPSIGYIRGEGAVYSGTIVSQDGTPLAPGGVTVLASTDGRITVLVMAFVGSPDLRLGSETHQHEVRSSADIILKSFDWDAR